MTAGAIQSTDFFLVQSYQQQGVRVILTGGSGWSPSMRRHYGVRSEPFFSRPSRLNEQRAPNGHPWGWVCKPDELIKDEARWLSPQDTHALKEALEQELQSLEATR